jgi:hypothetical protein
MAQQQYFFENIDIMVFLSDFTALLKSILLIACVNPVFPPPP